MPVRCRAATTVRAAPVAYVTVPPGPHVVSSQCSRPCFLILLCQRSVRKQASKTLTTAKPPDDPCRARHHHNRCLRSTLVMPRHEILPELEAGGPGPVVLRVGACPGFASTLQRGIGGAGVGLACQSACGLGSVVTGHAPPPWSRHAFLAVVTQAGSTQRVLLLIVTPFTLVYASGPCRQTDEVARVFELSAAVGTIQTELSVVQSNINSGSVNDIIARIADTATARAMESAEQQGVITTQIAGIQSQIAAMAAAQASTLQNIVTTNAASQAETSTLVSNQLAAINSQVTGESLTGMRCESGSLSPRALPLAPSFAARPVRSFSSLQSDARTGCKTAKPTCRSFRCHCGWAMLNIVVYVAPFLRFAPLNLQLLPTRRPPP